MWVLESDEAQELGVGWDEDHPRVQGAEHGEPRDDDSTLSVVQSQSARDVLRANQHSLYRSKARCALAMDF